MAYPTTLALIAALWTGPGAPSRSPSGRASAARSPRSARCVRGAARALLVGLGLPGHPAARRGRARSWPSSSCRPRQRGDRPGGQPGRDPVGPARRGARPRRSTSPPVPEKGALVVGLAAIALAALGALLLRQRRARNPLYDLDIAGRRIFWVAACAGIIVFGSLMGAMFIGQQFLQNVLGYSTFEAGLSILPAALHGAGRAAVGEARGGARRPAHAAHRLRLLPARFPHDVPPLEGGHLLLAGGSRLRVPRHRRRVRRHARVALADRLRPGPACRHGLGHRRPPARPGRGDHAVHPRRAPDRRYAAAVASAVAAVTGQPTSHDSVQTQLKKSFASAEAVARAVPAVRRRRSRPRRRLPSSTATSGPTRPGSSPILLGATLVFFLFPRKDEEERLLARYHAEDAVTPPAEPARSTARPGDRPRG